jgi:hypothetical protein
MCFSRLGIEKVFRLGLIEGIWNTLMALYASKGDNRRRKAAYKKEVRARKPAGSLEENGTVSP